MEARKMEEGEVYIDGVLYLDGERVAKKKIVQDEEFKATVYIMEPPVMTEEEEREALNEVEAALSAIYKCDVTITPKHKIKEA